MKLTDMKMPCHVVRRLRRNVLQVSQEREVIGVGYLDATAECSVQAFQDVVCYVSVVATQILTGPAPCLVTSRPLRKIFLAAPFPPPPSLLSLVVSPSYPSHPHNQSPVPCWLQSGKKIGAFSFKSYCDKTTGI